MQEISKKKSERETKETEEGLFDEFQVEKELKAALGIGNEA